MEILFSKYFRAFISYDGMHRIETFEYPREAFREALLNAVAHKDYSGGVPIQISVYKDKLMIWNEGQLPEDWTIETLLEKHSSKPYNPDIATALFRSGYIESWGRGISKMTEQCLEMGLPEPTFYYRSSGFWVEFKKDVYNIEHLGELGLNDRQLDALLFFKEKGEIVNAQYVARYNVTDKTARRDLVELVDKQLLLKTGQKKSTKYVFP